VQVMRTLAPVAKGDELTITYIDAAVCLEPVSQVSSFFERVAGLHPICLTHTRLVVVF
jgi:hypothetical protein